MKKGFTLVELLAVIVILSVIAIITVPIIGNVIEESRKKALEQSAHGLVESANYYAIEHEGEYSFIFDNNHNGETSNGEKLDYKGSIEGNGKLYIDNNGDISLCINTNKYYVYKNYDSGIVIGNTREKGECTVKKQGNHYVAYLENEGMDDYITSSDLALYALKTDLDNYATKEYVDTQDNILSGRIGSLSDLNVSDENKDNLVSAINEINSNLGLKEPQLLASDFSGIKSDKTISLATINSSVKYILVCLYAGTNSNYLIDTSTIPISSFNKNTTYIYLAYDTVYSTLFDFPHNKISPIGSSIATNGISYAIYGIE